jgi:membrane protein DedA with SNARE-associated domain
MSHTYLFLSHHAEGVLFAAVFAEQIGLPLPAIPILLAAGVLVGQGVLNPLSALVITVVASVLADLIWFYLGRRGGEGLWRFLRKFSLGDSASIEKTKGLFAEHGMAAVTGAKFVPWLGCLVPPLAGMFRIGVGRFLVFDTLGSVLYAIVFLALGYLFDGQLNALLEFVSHFGTVSAALISLLILFVFWHKQAHRRKPARSDSTSLATLPRV